MTSPRSPRRCRRPQDEFNRSQPSLHLRVILSKRSPVLGDPWRNPRPASWARAWRGSTSTQDRRRAHRPGPAGRHGRSWSGTSRWTGDSRRAVRRSPRACRCFPASAYSNAGQAAYDRATATNMRLPQEPGILQHRHRPDPRPGRMANGRPRRPPPGWVSIRRPRSRTSPISAVVLQHRPPLARLALDPRHRRKVGWLMGDDRLQPDRPLVWWPRKRQSVDRLPSVGRAPRTFDNLHHLVGFCLHTLAVLADRSPSISFPQTSHALSGPVCNSGRRQARNALGRPRRSPGRP